MLVEKLKQSIRDIPDFPKRGVVFKDITPILQDPQLCAAVIDSFADRLAKVQVDAVAGVESRGFLFGLMLANRLGVPFIPIRKQGKLPHDTISESYELEYGTATIEIHADALPVGAQVLVHDDLLATGGTVVATSKLIEKVGAKVAGFTFLISLDFLEAERRLKHFSDMVISLVHYN